jgi:hypothetical protein
MKVEGFNPTSGPVGTAVTIALSDIPANVSQADFTINLGDRNLSVTGFGYGYGTRDGFVRATVASGSKTGTFRVRVESLKGPVETTSSEEFDVTAEPSDEPTFTGMAPQFISAGEPTRLVLVGSGFDSVTQLRVGNAQTRNFPDREDDELAASVTVSESFVGQTLLVRATWSRPPSTNQVAICPFPLKVERKDD